MCFTRVLRAPFVHIRIVQELKGHKTIGMTVRYAYLAQKHTLSAVECLDTVAQRSEQVVRIVGSTTLATLAATPWARSSSFVENAYGKVNYSVRNRLAEGAEIPEPSANGICVGAW